MTSQWPEPGSCIDHPTPDLWLPPGPEEPIAEARQRQAIAKSYCLSCPVIDYCEAEIDPRYDEGVKGGQVLPALRSYRSIGYSVGVVRQSPRQAA